MNALLPTAWLQHRLGTALRSRVAGPNADEHAHDIWSAEGPRWFSASDPIWRVNADAAMLPGGIAALLLQSMHPLAMAGVAGHSGFKGDPWGRLQRTGLYLATTTFGTEHDAEKMIARVRGIHRRIHGEDFRGRPYSASDPDLLRWVHVAQVSSFLEAYQAYGPKPLSPQEADLFVVQSNRAAALLGATDLPTSVHELREQLRSFRPVVEATPAAREAASFLLLNPPVSLLERPGYALIAAGGVALLPLWARMELRLPLLFPAAPISRRIGRIGTGLIRWGFAGMEQPRPSDAR
jgi:uncharacterized protein (DUF2236 family)